MFSAIGLTHVVFLAALMVTLYRVRKALPGSGLHAWHARHVFPRAVWHRVLLLELIELALAAVFLLVGGAKLIGRPDMVALFRDIGAGQWFRYLTGTVEVTGAALLIIPRLSGGSAILLGGVMFVATLIELFVLHRPPVAALACLSGHAFVGWARVSKRHVSWLHPDTPMGHVRGVSIGSMKARWTFRRIAAGHDRRRPTTSLYGVIVNRAGSDVAGSSSVAPDVEAMSAHAGRLGRSPAAASAAAYRQPRAGATCMRIDSITCALYSTPSVLGTVSSKVSASAMASSSLSCSIKTSGSAA